MRSEKEVGVIFDYDESASVREENRQLSFVLAAILAAPLAYAPAAVAEVYGHRARMAAFATMSSEDLHARAETMRAMPCPPGGGRGGTICYSKKNQVLAEINATLYGKCEPQE